MPQAQFDFKPDPPQNFGFSPDASQDFDFVPDKPTAKSLGPVEAEIRRLNAARLAKQPDILKRLESKWTEAMMPMVADPKMWPVMGAIGIATKLHPAGWLLPAGLAAYGAYAGGTEAARKGEGVAGTLGGAGEALFPIHEAAREVSERDIAGFVGTTGGTLSGYKIWGRVFKAFGGAKGEIKLREVRGPRINLLPTAEQVKAAKGGVTVIPPRKDLGPLARYLGSPSQQFKKVSSEADEAVYQSIYSDILANTSTKRNAAITRQVSQSISNTEWQKLVSLLDDPKVTPENLPATLRQETRNGYLKLRAMDDDLRLRYIKASREGDIIAGRTAEQAEIRTPDDWGMEFGHYHHAFEGNWAIFTRTVTAKGKRRLIPIDTGWRQVTESAALQRAAEYKASSPAANVVVMLDEVGFTLSAGRGGTGRLRRLAKQIQEASKLEGAELEAAIDALKRSAGAAAYGPPKAGARFFGATQPRRSNLPGWLRTPEAFNLYVRGMERAIQMVKLRPQLQNYRNALAKRLGDKPAQTTDLPRRTGAEILGALDDFIDVAEGRPNKLEASLRRYFALQGWNPNTLARADRAIVVIESMLKLGFSPVAAAVNHTQTLYNTWSVLGTEWTLKGYRGYVKGTHEWLLRHLGVRELASKVEESTFRDYVSGYRPRSLREVPGAAGEAVIDSGLFMFRGTEAANISIAATGFYERALAQGASREGAIRAALEGNIRVNFLYGKLDSPYVLRMLPASLKQFKTFAFKQMEFILGLKGEEAARFWTALIATVGLVGLPGIDFLDDIIKAGTGALARAGLMKAAISPLDELKIRYPRTVRGVTGLAGVDLTRNIGFSEYFGPQLISPRDVMSPVISDLNNALTYLTAGEGRPSDEARVNLLRNVSPQARRLHEVFLTDLRQGILRDPVPGRDRAGNRIPGAVIQRNIPLTDRVLYAIGVTPMSIASERDLYRYVQEYVVKPYMSGRPSAPRGREQERLQRQLRKAPLPLRKRIRELYEQSEPVEGKPRSELQILDQPEVKQASIALGALVAFAASRGKLSPQAEEMAVRSATELMNRIPAEVTRKMFSELKESKPFAHTQTLYNIESMLKLGFSPVAAAVNFKPGKPWAESSDVMLTQGTLKNKFGERGVAQLVEQSTKLAEAYRSLPSVRNLLDGARRYVHGDPGLGIMQDISSKILRGADALAAARSSIYDRRGRTIVEGWPVLMADGHTESIHPPEEFAKGAQALVNAIKTAVPEQVRVYRGEFLETSSITGPSLRRQQLQALKPGDIIELDRLMSFADAKQVAESFSGKRMSIGSAEGKFVFETIGPVKRINVAPMSAFEEQEALTFGRWRVEKVSVEKSIPADIYMDPGEPTLKRSMAVPTHTRIVIRQIDAFEREGPGMTPALRQLQTEQQVPQ
jgi:hypothetical protein